MRTYFVTIYRNFNLEDINSVLGRCHLKFIDYLDANLDSFTKVGTAGANDFYTFTHSGSEDEVRKVFFKLKNDYEHNYHVGAEFYTQPRDISNPEARELRISGTVATVFDNLSHGRHAMEGVDVNNLPARERSQQDSIILNNQPNSTGLNRMCAFTKPGWGF